MAKMHRVFVGGLNENVKREDIEAEFGQFGNISNVWVAFNPPGFGFMEFDSLESAEIACDRMNGANFMGCTLRVEISRNQGPFRGRGGRSSRGGGRFRGGGGPGRDDRRGGGRGGRFNDGGRGFRRGGSDGGGYGRRDGNDSYEEQDGIGGYDREEDGYNNHEDGYGGGRGGGGFGNRRGRRDDRRGGGRGERFRGGNNSGGFGAGGRAPRFSGNKEDDGYQNDFGGGGRGGGNRTDRYRSRSPNASRK